MNASPETPATAPAEAPSFTFDRFVVKKALFEQTERAEREPDEKRPPILAAGLRLVLQVEQDAEASRARVTLIAGVDTDQKWQPYKIEVVVVGYFREVNGKIGLLEQFCMHSAPTILFPYIRQVVHNLTRDAAFGIVLMNPVNLQHLVPSEKPGSEQESPAVR